MKKEQIVKIAKDIRRKCYKFAMDDRRKGYDFLGNEDLRCMCLSASQVLREALRRRGIGSTIHEHADDGWSHAFVRAGNMIIDITATQFGDDEVVITRRDRLKKQECAFQYYDDSFRVTEDRVKIWPESQKLKPEVVEKILNI